MKNGCHMKVKYTGVRYTCIVYDLTLYCDEN